MSKSYSVCDCMQTRKSFSNALKPCECGYDIDLFIKNSPNTYDILVVLLNQSSRVIAKQNKKYKPVQHVQIHKHKYDHLYKDKDV